MWKKDSDNVATPQRNCYAHIGEALSLEWTDIDFETNTIILNTPEKNGLCRNFKISHKLAAMLNALPKTHKKAFGIDKVNSVIQNFSLKEKKLQLNFKIQDLHE